MTYAKWKITLLRNLDTHNIDAIEKTLALGHENNYDINFTTLRGYNPLSIAIATGNWQIVETLFNHGADANYPNSLPITGYALDKQYDLRTYPPLWVAMSKHNISMIEYLLQNGANPNNFLLGGNSILYNSLLYEYYNTTPLHYAIYLNNPKIVEILLKYNANIQAKDGKDQLPTIYLSYNTLQWSIFPTTEITHDIQKSVAIFKLLISHYTKLGVKPGQDIFNTRINGTPILCHIIETWDYETLKVFLTNEESQSLVNCKDKNMLTPLHYAAKNDDFITVLHLLLANSNPHDADKHGNTPLTYTSAESECHTLLYNNTHPHTKHFTITAIEKCIITQDVLSLKIMLASNSNCCSILNKKNRNILQFAIEHGKTNIIMMLLEYQNKHYHWNNKIDLYSRDSEDLTALNLAIQCEQFKVARQIVITQSNENKEMAYKSINELGSNDKASSFHRAIMHGNIPLIRTMLEHTADMQINFQNKSPLELAHSCAQNNTISTAIPLLIAFSMNKLKTKDYYKKLYKKLTITFITIALVYLPYTVLMVSSLKKLPNISKQAYIVIQSISGISLGILVVAFFTTVIMAYRHHSKSRIIEKELQESPIKVDLVNNYLIAKCDENNSNLLKKQTMPALITVMSIFTAAIIAAIIIAIIYLMSRNNTFSYISVPQLNNIKVIVLFFVPALFIFLSLITAGLVFKRIGDYVEKQSHITLNTDSKLTERNTSTLDEIEPLADDETTPTPTLLLDNNVHYSEAQYSVMTDTAYLTT